MVFAFPPDVFYLLDMLGPLSQRILTVLQLTRMALVFTAISNGACEVLLSVNGKDRYLENLDPRRLAAMAAVSVGLYGFGMSLNDIIDRRRDMRIASHRPLPSGRIRLVTAYAICVCLALLAGWGGAAYAHWTPATGSRSFGLLVITGMLIIFYDFAGKYLVALGLLSLGMIRFLQASIGAPPLQEMVIWHPLLLLNHVAILSTVAYHWEQKRPSLTRKHWGTVLGGLAGIDIFLITAFGWHFGDQTLSGMLKPLHVNGSLLPVVIAVLGFVGVAFWIRRRNPIPTDAGQKLVLFGLLWLIIYDAAFVAGYVSWFAAAMLFCLLPVAYWSVQLMRWWSKLVSVAQRPVFQRARS